MKNHSLSCLAVAFAALTVTPAWAQDAAAFQRCRATTDNTARLACYDALTPAAQPAVKANAAATANTTEGFGLATEAEKTPSIASQINGAFEGWDGNVEITLANGQVWRITDGSRAYVNLMNPKVKVERGAFGAYYLNIDGMNQAPRVRRVK
jgi:hypothetical protein